MRSSEIALGLSYYMYKRTNSSTVPIEMKLTGIIGAADFKELAALLISP